LKKNNESIVLGQFYAHHKKFVGAMSLRGMTTKEITRRIYHTEVAVDPHLKTFGQLLILRHYNQWGHE